MDESRDDDAGAIGDLHDTDEVTQVIFSTLTSEIDDEIKPVGGTVTVPDSNAGRTVVTPPPEQSTVRKPYPDDPKQSGRGRTSKAAARWAEARTSEVLRAGRGTSGSSTLEEIVPVDPEARPTKRLDSAPPPPPPSSTVSSPSSPLSSPASSPSVSAASSVPVAGTRRLEPVSSRGDRRAMGTTGLRTGVFSAREKMVLVAAAAVSLVVMGSAYWCGVAQAG